MATTDRPKDYSSLRELGFLLKQNNAESMERFFNKLRNRSGCPVLDSTGSSLPISADHPPQSSLLAKELPTLLVADPALV